MENPEKMIELNPREWSSERPKPHEPFFGEGLPGGIAYAVGWIAMFSVIYFVTH